MWTATVKNKEEFNGAIKVTVDFSNGTKTVTETCIPQDKDGFTHWVKSRLATFNMVFMPSASHITHTG